jgi:IPT/TIG domain
MSATIDSSSVPLKDRFYIYRGTVLHQKKESADFDQMYWQMVPKPAAPTLVALNPATAPANLDVTVNITGTGFDAGAKAVIGTTQLSPMGTVTQTAFSVVIPAAQIATAGAHAVSVKNGDGQLSNAINFSVT